VEYSQSRVLPFFQVDVFGNAPFKGNPVAVVLQADDLTAPQMQEIANWTNLSETTFVCEPTTSDADYRLRIFTTRSELPFAGHPTIGSAAALLRHGLRAKVPGRLVQECARGLVSLRLDGDRVFLELPEPAFTSPSECELADALAALGVSPEAAVNVSIVDVGAVWLTLQLDSAQGVLDLEPDMDRLAQATKRFTGVTVFGLHVPGGPASVEVRSFVPGDGVPEDPVCGSGNGCVAALIRRNRVLTESRYVAAQGRVLGRDGRIEVEFYPDGAIWLGGTADVRVSGLIALRA
jgi:PhzF family phenazine biosynthesis protein